MLLFLGGSTLLSFYVETLWFAALGYSDVFWRTLGFKSWAFTGFTLVTFVVVYGALWLLRPRVAGVRSIYYVNGQPVSFSLEPLIRTASLVVALLVALGAGSGMMSEWATFALFAHAPSGVGLGALADPIFGRPVGFYLFTLPVWQLVITWLTTISLVVLVASVLSFLLSGGLLGGTGFGAVQSGGNGYRPISVGLAFTLAVMAGRVYVSRFERLFDDHTVFSGVGYTEAHILIPGLTLVARPRWWSEP